MADTPFTHKYIPRITQREENLFVEEYYSSTDTKIIMGDVEQTEIGYISYAVQEQLKPLYGYNSRTYDDVAIGNRIVTGVFKVPIKNPEGQTQMDELTAYAITGGEEFIPEDYNLEEENLQNAVEWINDSLRDVVSGGGGTAFAPGLNDPDNKFYSHLSQIVELGLTDRYGNKITMSSSQDSIKQAIQEFQKANNIEPTGELTEQTVSALETQVFDKWAEKEEVTLPVNQKVYLGPGTDYSYSTLSSARNAAIIDKTSAPGWWQVDLNPGGLGWIQVQGGES